MGYKNIKMTLRYSHPTPEHKKRAVEILDEVTTIFTTPEKKARGISFETFVNKGSAHSSAG